MSACQQAKAARRKAKYDPRYANKGTRDVVAAQKRLAQRIATERRIASKGK